MRCWVSNTVRRRVFGGVSGDHRGDQRADEGIGDGAGIQVRSVEFQIGRGQAAVLWWLTGGLVGSPAALAMNVLGDVGQQREVGERADDGDRPVHVDAVEQLGQIGTVDLRTAHPERLDTRAFNQIEHRVAVLFSHRLAQDRAEQADVLAHRFSGLPAHLGAPYGSDRFQAGVGNAGCLSHRSIIGRGRRKRRTGRRHQARLPYDHSRHALPGPQGDHHGSGLSLCDGSSGNR